MPEKRTTVIENIKICYEQLFSAEKKVADCILEDPGVMVMLNISELAAKSGASEATVVRMCKHVGYQGYYQMRLILSHDLGKREDSYKRETIESAQRIFDQNAVNSSALGNEIDMESLVKCAELLKRSRLVYVVAAGNTMPIALDLGFRLERFGIPCSYGVIPEHFLNHVSLGTNMDTIIAISRSGASKQVIQAMELAKRIGIQAIVITGEQCSPISQMADYTLLSHVKDDLFPASNEPDSHLCEMAVCDALLYVVKHLDAITKNIESEQNDEHGDEIELLLSEYKL